MVSSIHNDGCYHFQYTKDRNPTAFLGLIGGFHTVWEATCGNLSPYGLSFQELSIFPESLHIEKSAVIKAGKEGSPPQRKVALSSVGFSARKRLPR